MERLRTLWEFLRTSFWFVPSLMAAGAVGLVALTIWVERSMTAASPSIPWFLYVGEPADAETVLSTILSSMITMATLVFSITMVVLTLAASQFGPRLIRSFMANPQTQVVLGTFVMTIVYCLLVLPVVGSREGSGKLPYASVSIALALTILSIGLLVLFLHILARSIVSETVIERVGNELDELLDELAPLDATGPTEVPTQQLLPADFEQRAAFFGSQEPGYVQAIQFERLVAIAEKAEALIVLYFRAGHYVVPGSREFAVYPGERLNKELRAEIQDAILTGVHRTPVQDPDFSLRHLDEIADRALSAAVNDPYTAVAVIDRLSASLCKLMSRALPAGVFRGRDGALRLACTQPTYGGLIEAGFNQIRQNGAGMPIIVLHLLEAIERVGEHVRLPVQHEALAEQARVIMEAARSRVRDEFDRQRIEERYATVQQALDRAATVMGGSGRAGRVPSTVPAP
ncbi:DUF2254 domain-containing protein [Microvirga makkahensis]|uniref:DUF2254 domain-containing protein n=1 Tax=Microvirga makkahensis TaxID=1128670 RepID=A0A7X3SML9_9HYPH|nr:DUF2254 domain-containing protein [Microvirga makkahensis]MXQ10502.1 DUF2254 domain-containing protein [Microvirga makkahensis]